MKCSINRLASSFVDIFPLIAINCAPFVNRSAITMIASCSVAVNGKPVMMSIPIDAHRAAGTSNGCKNLGGFPSRDLFLRHDSHVDT
ncbi:hypothetical protein PHMEG_00016952 [Phytophthora megakarya]|uniref:Uncharacterized protein n=1 Tax=Phytophthora megakarya TaxID=4795 RepID=A0A225VZK5_9STRA|nr:hypothetical protein PHMEG_00016952 [Phytophthora megakarya]